MLAVSSRVEEPLAFIDARMAAFDASLAAEPAADESFRAVERDRELMGQEAV